MRTLGLIGGMSWESTLIYYRLINQGVAARAGGLDRRARGRGEVDALVRAHAIQHRMAAREAEA